MASHKTEKIMYKSCEWARPVAYPGPAMLNEGTQNVDYYKYRVELNGPGMPERLKPEDIRWLNENIKCFWAIIYCANHDNEKNKITCTTVLGFADEDMAMAFKLMWL